MFCRDFFISVAALSVFFLTSAANLSVANASFDFAPIIATLAPNGAAATTSFNVTNHSDTKIPIQVTIVAREPDLLGNEVYKETDQVSEMFRIFPDQVILNPRETRAVRVSYVGTPKIKAELAFRIIAEQLPVDVNDPNKKYTKAVARVSLATKYVGSLYVSPSGVKPEVLVEVKPADPQNKKLMITVTNKGTGHQVIRKPVVRLQPQTGGTEIVLDGPEVKHMVNQNILAGKVRQFTLDWPKKLAVGPVKGSIDFPKE